MIETGKDIDVFDTANNKIATLGFADGKFSRELMSEHYIQLILNYNNYFKFGRGIYVIYQNRTYTIREESQPEQKGLSDFKYTLKFESIEMFFQDFILFYTFQNMKEAEWTLTGTPQQFLQIAISCINNYFGLTTDSEKWKIGIFPAVSPINLSFDSQNTFDALTYIAEEFNSEWWLDYNKKTLNLGYYESDNEEIDLAVDQALKELRQSKENNDDYCTRLFAFGGTRNIPTNYRGVIGGESVVDALVQKRLRLPFSNGDFIDAMPNMDQNQIIERVKIFDHVFPKRTGEITSLRVDDTQKDNNGNPWLIYYFKDSGLNFSSDYILPGLTLSLTFGDNSWLAGRTFELAYHEDTQEFEIINNQDIPDLAIPNDVLRPRIGDNYVLFNFDIALVGNQYVGEAEQELLEESTKWMDSIQYDNNTYTCPVNPVWAYYNNLDMGLGQKVNLISDILKYGVKKSRVFGYEKSLETFEDTYTIGDKPRYSRLKSIDKTIETNREISDLQYLEAMKVANGSVRTMKGLNYLRTAFQNKTEIRDGLVLSSLILLGQMVGNVWKENAGINGINNGENDVAFWAGGSLDQAVNTANNPYLMEDFAQSVVTHLGKLIANDVFLRGRFESNKDGLRIVIDPERRSLTFDDTNSGNGIDIVAVDGMPSIIASAILGGRTAYGYNSHDGLYVRNRYSDSTIEEASQYYAGIVNITKTEGGTTFNKFSASVDGGTLEIILQNLPKSAQGLKPNQLWLNNGKLEITPEESI